MGYKNTFPNMSNFQKEFGGKGVTSHSGIAENLSKHVIRDANLGHHKKHFFKK